LCVTTEILNEYVEILQRETTENFASIMLEVILNNPNTLFINIFYKFNLIISDPDDNKFIDCAIAAQAKYIVTEDHHYDVLRDLEFPKVDIIGLDDAMRMIK
jgi:putative PIN family toxin of toxin-antitoxin system